jgi:hypothetical protein
LGQAANLAEYLLLSWRILVLKTNHNGLFPKTEDKN